MEFAPEESQRNPDVQAEPKSEWPEEAPEEEEVEDPSVIAGALAWDRYLSLDFETRRKVINGFWSLREREKAVLAAKRSASYAEE